MSANRTQNSHLHRVRYRSFTRNAKRHTKRSEYLTVQAARLTALVGVTSVTIGEIAAAHIPFLNPTVDLRARHIRGATTAADVTALGINIL